MSESRQPVPVRCWRQQVVIPTYPIPPADPNPFTDRLALEKKDITYNAIFLENEFIQLMILPELGGRTHAGLDKTNHYDFFYRQHVIKPALVGLLGPWISGGVEFNWPQHRRPSTFMPVHTSIEEHSGGARTVWLGEHEPMQRMKGMVGVHLEPGKALVEVRVRLFNRTPLPHTFLWWANAAVRVHDHKLQAGLVHTSNHHVAPGKKLWTWGNAEFGHAWDRNLTDEDGPYIELMAGAYTDNQPDFSWLQPYETRTFSQYWYPIQKIGPAKNANTEAAVNLEFEAGHAHIGVCVTAPRTVHVLLTANGQPLLDETLDLAPGQPFTRTIATSANPAAHRLSVLDADGKEFIAYQPETPVDRPLPEPPSPHVIESVEELYLTGLHLEQYRHATRSSESYWLEGLAREPNDSRFNNAMGMTYLRRGLFAEAEDHFARAVRRLTFRNPNPYDGEPLYNLGLARLYQGKTDEAYDAFHKCVWNQAWQSAGYYAQAAISIRRGNPRLAQEQVELSLLTNGANLSARALKASLLRRLNSIDAAQAVIDDTLALDPLCFRMKAEQFLLSRTTEALRAFVAALDGDIQTLLDVAFDLAWSGMRGDAYDLLQAFRRQAQFEQPMLWYTLSWLAAWLGHKRASRQYAAKAEAASPLYCFPARLEEMLVLEDAIERNPRAARAHYYLGNLYYDKRRYHDAIRCWRRSVALDSGFSIPLRNLGIAEFNVLHNPEAADQMYRRAFAANPADARLLFEWDQLRKRACLASPPERLRQLQAHPQLVAQRDDLTVEFITLLNQDGQSHAALEHLRSRRFNPWEGGEGLVSAQYVHAHRTLGMQALATKNPAQAMQHFEAARHYPWSLGEGKHLLTLERDLDYFTGLAAHRLGDAEHAQQYFHAAAAPLPELGMHSYFQAQAMQALGNRQAARAVFSSLSEYAQRLAVTEPSIDYFAASLPNMLLFDDDLAKRNRIESLLLSALASHGLGDTQTAILQLRQLLAEDPNHIFAAQMLFWIESAAQVDSKPSPA
ncbi:MAG: DUF5107 domain-containing protein [Terracidiphilus sp.]|nr:DUF5107 domain-containing protein [Terracidiphilus sp.]